MQDQTTSHCPRLPDRFERFGIAREVVAERRGGDRRSRGPARSAAPRNPLKTHKTAKSPISRLNDFKGLQGGRRSILVSFAKFSLRLRNFCFASRRAAQKGRRPRRTKTWKCRFFPWRGRNPLESFKTAKLNLGTAWICKGQIWIHLEKARKILAAHRGGAATRVSMEPAANSKAFARWCRWGARQRVDPIDFPRPRPYTRRRSQRGFRPRFCFFAPRETAGRKQQVALHKKPAARDLRVEPG
jgi:hypothetical protein